VESQAFKTALQVGDGSGLADLVEIGLADLAISNAFGEHVIGGDEDLVGDREGCPHAASTGLQTIELVLEIAAFGAGGRDGSPDQHRSQMDVAVAGSPAFLFASAFMVAGAHASPGGEVVDAQEHAHVDADLGDQHGGNQPIDARNLHQQGMGSSIRLQFLIDARVERGDLLFGGFEPAQLQTEQEAMVLLDPALECQNQVGPFAPQLTRS
jgi:hypothetical protein